MLTIVAAFADPVAPVRRCSGSAIVASQAERSFFEETAEAFWLFRQCAYGSSCGDLLCEAHATSNHDTEDADRPPRAGPGGVSRGSCTAGWNHPRDHYDSENLNSARQQARGPSGTTLVSPIRCPST